jgi:hypothetical protein
LNQYKAQDYYDKDRPYSFCLCPLQSNPSKRTFICSSASQEGTAPGILISLQRLRQKYYFLQHLKIEEKLRTNYRIPPEEIEWKEEIAAGASGVVKKGKKLTHINCDEQGFGSELPKSP